MIFGEKALVEQQGGTFLPILGRVDVDEKDWRAINVRKLDIPPEVLDKSRRFSYYLYLTNPLAQRLVNLMTSFIVGGPVSIKAKDPTVQELLDRFWTDKINGWELKLPSRVVQLSLYGEWVMPVGVDKNTGYVRVGFINPIDVRNVITDPTNVEDALELQVIPTKPPAEAIAGDVISLKVIRPIDIPKNKHFGRLSGEVFYFALNKVSDASRGTPDLMAYIDYLSQFDTMLFNLKERAAHMNSWLWDVTVTDGTEDNIQALLDDFVAHPPKPGSIRAHNQKVDWSQIKPDLAASDMGELLRIFKMYIVGNFGFPEHFTGMSDAGRIAAASMEEPTYKTLQSRQLFVEHILEFILQFVIDQKSIVDGTFARRDQSFSVDLPDITVRDVQRTGAAMLRITQALEIAMRNEWISKDEARRMLKTVANMLGMELSSEQIPAIKSQN